MADPSLPVLAGRYRALERLGEGGMGVVWQARDELLHREVAIKEVRIDPHLPEAHRVEMRERTLREARAAARLSHPSIVAVHDVIAQDGRPWIVMDLVRGRSLGQAMRADGPLPPRWVAAIGLAVLDALALAHSRGIVHRDVKPANIMLAQDGGVLLTDFGIATLEGEVQLTSPDALVGSPGYIAPERLRGTGDGPAADLWSLGATLYAAVEGRGPFQRDTPVATLGAVLTQETPFPPGRRPWHPCCSPYWPRTPDSVPGSPGSAPPCTRSPRGFSRSRCRRPGRRRERPRRTRGPRHRGHAAPG
ncbi:serine/threonine-protein kinase [Streptosporangium lutulentum]